MKLSSNTLRLLILSSAIGFGQTNSKRANQNCILVKQKKVNQNTNQKKSVRMDSTKINKNKILRYCGPCGMG